MFRRLFTAHPASVGEGYAEHLGVALCFAGRLFLASLACAVHGLLPFLFVGTASASVAELNQRMGIARRRHAPSGPVPQAAPGAR